MVDHTPTPWFHDRVEGDSYSHISSKPGEGGDIATAWVTGDVNAAFIVKAVNAHDALVKALKDLVTAAHNEAIDMRVMRQATEILASLKERA